MFPNDIVNKFLGEILVNKHADVISSEVSGIIDNLSEKITLKIYMWLLYVFNQSCMLS